MPSCVARVPAMEIEPRVAEAVRAALSDSNRQRSGGSRGDHPAASRPRRRSRSSFFRPSLLIPLTCAPRASAGAHAAFRERRLTSCMTSVRYGPSTCIKRSGSPSCMIFPLFKRTIRSKFRSVESRCAAAMTVRPCMRRESASRIASSASLSRADVASSKRRIGEFFRKARAIATRWR